MRNCSSQYHLRFARIFWFLDRSAKILTYGMARLTFTSGLMSAVVAQHVARGCALSANINIHFLSFVFDFWLPMMPSCTKRDSL
jgi:hypothetical protein